MPRKKRPTRRELRQGIRAMVGKAMELGWSPNLTEEERREAFNSPKFVYVKLGQVWGPWKKNAGGFIVHWGAEKIGFGEMTFAVKEGKVLCDAEGMGKEFCRKIMWKFLDSVKLVGA